MHMTDTSREALRALLPWYENGTLDHVERESVRALLATDLEANRQRRELHALREVLSNEPILAANMVSNLERLQVRLHAGAAPARIAIAPRWLAAAAVLAFGAGLALFFAGENVGRYRTLSAPDNPVAVPADVLLLRVDVVAGIDAATLEAIADDADVHVLRGPSEHGVATLQAPRVRAQQIQARLRADPRLRFVAVVER